MCTTTASSEDSYGVSDLTGIEYFTSLVSLDCSVNYLGHIDLSRNTNLENITCTNCGLEELKLHSNTALKLLICDNQDDPDIGVYIILTAARVVDGSDEYYEIIDRMYDDENNPTSSVIYPNDDGTVNVLVYRHESFIHRYLNRLQSLDLRSNTALQYVYCPSCDIAAIDVSGCPSLWRLDCSRNRIESLDVSRNTALYILYCNNNLLTHIDVSRNTALQSLTCGNEATDYKDDDSDFNNEEGYRPKSIPILTGNMNHIMTLDLSNNTALDSLNCAYAGLTALDLGNKSLSQLECGENRISRLDLSKSMALSSLYCEKNNLATLDVSKQLSMYELFCYSNDLTELILGSKPKLFELYCSRNRLSAIDISQCPELRDFSCAKNQIRELDISKNTQLIFLYCHNNLIKNIDVSNNSLLNALSCTNNKLSKLDISHNPDIYALDCGGNYLAELDVSHNPRLEELYFSGTTLRNVDLSTTTNLISLDCISADMTTLDLSTNTQLKAVNLYGNSRLEALYVTSSDNPSYPFKTDMREYTGNNYSRILSVKAYSKEDTDINTSFTSSDSFAYFASSPHYIIYDYSTGYTGSADINAVPKAMSVRMSIPTHSFTYLPQIESKVVSVDSKVVSRDEINYSSKFYGNRSGQRTGQQTSITEEHNEEAHEDLQTGDGNGPGAPKGGCNSGAGILPALCMMFFACSGRHRGKLFVVALILTAGSCAYAQVRTSDYTLPIPYEIYDISGSWTTDFAFTPELAGTIADILGISSDKVHSYADIAMPGTWNVTAQDLYNLSSNGEYGGVVLPLSEHGTSTDRLLRSARQFTERIKTILRSSLLLMKNIIRSAQSRTTEKYILPYLSGLITSTQEY